jgi:CheY-like chemotaxis protein
MARILLVEDEETQRRQMELLLRSADHTILLASNGAQALVVAKEKRPEVVVSDVVMPRMKGTELAEKIRATPGLESTYIILVTAVEGEGLKIESMLAGADDFVRKPVQKEDLLSRVEIGTRILKARREAAGLQGRIRSMQQVQDQLVAALDAALRGLEEGVSRLPAGDGSGAAEGLRRTYEDVRLLLSRVPLPEAG